MSDNEDENRPIRVVEIEDEQSDLALAALGLIRTAFDPHERQPLHQIAMEIAEKRLGLLTSYDFHLFAAVDTRKDSGDELLGIASGIYLAGVNCGFVSYLAAVPRMRSRGIGRLVRSALIDAFRADAKSVEWPDLAAVVGEVRQESPWLRRLVRDRAVLPLDLHYYHPGQDPETTTENWVLYWQPVGDSRATVPAAEVRQLLYAIWRRAHRVRWPLKRSAFVDMIHQLEDRDEVGELHFIDRPAEGAA